MQNLIFIQKKVTEKVTEKRGSIFKKWTPNACFFPTLDAAEC